MFDAIFIEKRSGMLMVGQNKLMPRQLPGYAWVWLCPWFMVLWQCLILEKKIGQSISKSCFYFTAYRSCCGPVTFRPLQSLVLPGSLDEFNFDDFMNRRIGILVLYSDFPVSKFLLFSDLHTIYVQIFKGHKFRCFLG